MGRRRLRCFNELGDAEVEQLDVPVPGDEDVLRLQVPVDDAALVRSRESLGHLRRPLKGRGQRNGALRQPLPQRLALEQLGDEVGLPVVEADVVKGDDVWVSQRSGQLGLAVEALQEAPSVPRASDTTLMATSRPSRVSLARYTSAMPPAPRRATTS